MSTSGDSSTNSQPTASSLSVDEALIDFANMVGLVLGKLDGFDQARDGIRDSGKSSEETHKKSLRVLQDLLFTAAERQSRTICRALDKSFEEKFNGLNQTVQSFLTRIDGLLGENSRFFQMFVAHAPFLQQYIQDHPAEKTLLAEFVRDEFFGQSKVRCFVQASTTAIYLGEKLASRASQCLFHTNSAVFPLTILDGYGFNTVYTLCGRVYDALCGGWLFTNADVDTSEYLRQLFTRNDDRLTIAFLMPRAITPDGGIYYRMDEAALMAKIVWEVADHVVVLAAADRLYRSSERTSDAPSLGAEWRSRPERRTSLVLAGTTSVGEDLFRPLLQGSGVEVHYIPAPEPG